MKESWQLAFVLGSEGSNPEPFLRDVASNLEGMTILKQVARAQVDQKAGEVRPRVEWKLQSPHSSRS